MALKIPKVGLPQFLKEGYQHHEGLEEAVYRNIEATKQLANITKTSLGPNGRNKMLINHLSKLFVSNDTATIIKELEVVHPAAKLLVMASQQQEAEMGDATNFVVVLAGELLQNAEYLLKMGLHPSEVFQGFELAAAKAQELIDSLAFQTVTDPTQKAQILPAVKSAIMSKQNGYQDLLADLVVEASLQVMPKSNPVNFSVDSVRVVKILGGGISDSRVVRGMVFGREPEGTIIRAEKAKVAIFSCPIDVQTTETKGTVLIHNAQEMLNFSKGEEDSLEQAIREVADSGVKVVVTGSACSDLALHFLNRFNILVIKILSKFELRRLCRVTGATAMTRLGAPTAEETGYCEVVETIEIGGDRCTVFRQEKEETKTSTIVIRGSTQNLMDDVERAIDDGVNTIKAIVKDGRVLPGAGATEIELAKLLTSYGEKTPGLAQYAILKYAEALEVVPRTLAENAGLDSTEVISKLYAAHLKNSNIGVNIESIGDIDMLLDAKEKQIFDILSIKKWAIKLATYAANTVLSVDQIIMSKPAGGPKVKEKKNWDED